MRVFGDDGFRDIFGKGFLSKKFLNFFFFKFECFFKVSKN